MVSFAGSNTSDLFQEMVSASWCGILASLSLLLEARYVNYCLQSVMHAMTEFNPSQTAFYPIKEVTCTGEQ